MRPGHQSLRGGLRTGSRGASALAFVLLALLGAVGCGFSPENEADEGVPIELDSLEINVQLTRFLNPTDPEDKSYLAGQTLPAPAGQSYLGVFLTMKNNGDEATRLPSADQMTVTDTTGAGYEAIPSSTPFAAPLGANLAGGDEIPNPDSSAESGPAQGSIVLFLVNKDVSENRPLKLEIEHEGETGDVTLDI
jgi:hypothetical protein